MNIIDEKKYRFDVQPHKKKERLDVYLTNNLENATRSRVQKLIKAGYVLVNGTPEKPNYNVSPNDIIEVTIPVSPRPDKAYPEEIPIDILYEDDYLIIVNKAAGMVVHPALGHFTGTLVNALLHHTMDLSEVDEPGRPGIVHRIDKETSGILVIAKDEVSHAFLAKQFADHSIEREYHAVCWGHFPEPSGEIIGNVARSEKDRKVFTVHEERGKHAHTFYEVIEEYSFASLVKLRLKTGRTHQIRVHMNHINHPVFGDPVYGGRRIVYGGDLAKMKSRVANLLEIMQRQALHAKTLGFIHPATKEKVKFDSTLPDDMLSLIYELKKY